MYRQIDNTKTISPITFQQGMILAMDILHLRKKKKDSLFGVEITAGSEKKT